MQGGGPPQNKAISNLAPFEYRLVTIPMLRLLRAWTEKLASLTNTSTRLLAASMLGVLLFRGATLEVYDLIDPTESRYASIAQEMVLGKDWLTPRIPMPTGIEPYLGKPPLHFWITAATFSLFGMDEWTSRLPSFVGMLAIVALLLLYANAYMTVDIGLAGAAILISSAVFFFFSGASVVDVTLSASIALAVVGFSLGSQRTSCARYLWNGLTAVGVALGFLTKGPVAVALVGTTVMGFCLLRRDFRPLKDYPWIMGLLLFLVIILPWFAWSESRNPGFVRYFLWNENIARYLFKDYGDLYGSGHRYVRGFAWILLLIAFLPWTPLLLQHGWRQRSSLRSESRAMLLAWGLSSATFFTLVRQLHIGYLLPSVPPFALLLADLLHNRDGIAVGAPITSSGERYFRWIRYGSMAISVIALIAIFITINMREPWESSIPVMAVCLVALLMGAAWYSTKSFSFTSTYKAFIGATATLTCAYALALVALTPWLDRHLSTESMLREMSNQIQEENPIIGVVTRNTFSHYWISHSASSEVLRPFQVTFLDTQNIATMRHILVHRKDFSKLPSGVWSHFDLRHEEGSWVWLERVVI